METSINCPKCDHEFHVEEALSVQFQKKIRQELQQEVDEKAAKLAQKEQTLKTLEKAVQKQKLDFEEELEKRIKEADFERRKELETEIRGEKTQEIEALKARIQLKTEENQSLKSRELQLLTEQEKLQSEREDLELTLKRRMADEKEKVKEAAMKQAREAFDLEKREMEKRNDDLRKKLEETTRKLDNKSQQLQGEVQEMALEENLKQAFPRDRVTGVKTGKRGADVVLEVLDKFAESTGKILFESKRTLHFQPSWIPKLKEDMSRENCVLGVIVSQVLPEGIEVFGYKDGIWVCQLEQVGSLALVLREQLIQVATVRKAGENKGDKMVMLYDFFTGPEFAQFVTQVMEGFLELDTQLEKEKASFQRQWKARAKIHSRVKQNLMGIVGSVEGIAGHSIEAAENLKLTE